MGNIVLVSGYFNPIHVGHIDYLDSASKIGDYLVVIVNNDNQVNIKGSKPFMPLKERLIIVESMGCVDKAVASIDEDGSVVETIRSVWQEFNNSAQAPFTMSFCNGGDRKLDNIPEYDICEQLGIDLHFNVGGGKTQSSSSLLQKVANEK